MMRRLTREEKNTYVRVIHKHNVHTHYARIDKGNMLFPTVYCIYIKIMKNYVTNVFRRRKCEKRECISQIFSYI